MNEKPILFSGPMVRALLNGTKTQTRRAVCLNHSGRVQRAGMNWHPEDPNVVKACPYGMPADTLWVRETFGFSDSDEETLVYRADRELIGQPWKPSIFCRRKYSRITLEIVSVRVERLQEISEADSLAEGIYRDSPTEEDLQWCEETYGHRDMDDVFIAPGTDCGFGPKPRKPQWGITAAHAYRALWESINGRDSWKANPWVWVVEFKVLPL